MGAPLIIPGVGKPIDKATVAESGVMMQMPMWLGETERDLWLLPFEPQVAVRGRNVITRRTIAKQKERGFGSVKELWTKDDYEITISGLLRDYTKPGVLPSEMITKLDGLCSLKKPLIAQCALLEALGASQVVIESWEFPPTEGIENQMFTIKAYSDQNFQLLIEK